MKKTKTVKKQKATKRIAKTTSLERERVNYEYNNKAKSIVAMFKKHTVAITAKQVSELISRRNDIKKFYSYCNTEIDLLSRLHADAQAKKQNECTNTQYDSRKKLLRLVIQLALTTLKQKAKAKTVKKETETVRASK